MQHAICGINWHACFLETSLSAAFWQYINTRKLTLSLWLGLASQGQDIVIPLGKTLNIGSGLQTKLSGIWYRSSIAIAILSAKYTLCTLISTSFFISTVISLTAILISHVCLHFHFSQLTAKMRRIKTTTAWREVSNNGPHYTGWVKKVAPKTFLL